MQQGSGLLLLLERAHERLLLGWSLEASMTEFGGCVDELECNVLQISPGRRDVQRFSNGDDSLVGSCNASLDHDEIVPDLAVMREATHWGDDLLRDVRLGRGVACIVSCTDTINLLILLHAMMITV